MGDDLHLAERAVTMLHPDLGARRASGENALEAPRAAASSFGWTRSKNRSSEKLVRLPAEQLFHARAEVEAGALRVADRDDVAARFDQPAEVGLARRQPALDGGPAERGGEVGRERLDQALAIR